MTTIRDGSILSPKNHELILFNNFWEEESFLAQDSTCFTNKESTLLKAAVKEYERNHDSQFSVV